MDPTAIYNWRRLTNRITTSGQPTEAELPAIAALGTSCVINLGLHSHARALPDEAFSVTGLGMIYVHIPVSFQAPTEQDFADFCDALDERRGEILHVHCIANYRVSAFFYRHRAFVDPVDPAVARADLEAIWTPDAVWSEFLKRGARTA